MATVGDIITSARYDLQDHGGQKWNNDQLVNYINRIVQLIDRILLTRNSDFTLATTTGTLSNGTNTVVEPTGNYRVIQIYNGSKRVYKKPRNADKKVIFFLSFRHCFGISLLAFGGLVHFLFFAHGDFLSFRLYVQFQRLVYQKDLF